MSPPSFATFDALWITRQLHETSRGITASELHALAYLSCLVSLLGGRAPESWGYDFAATSSGAPFATALDDAIEGLRSSGLLESRESVYYTSRFGNDEVALWSELESLRWRVRYLGPACDSALALPLPTVTGALTGEPQLRRAMRLNQTRELLDETGLEMLEPHLSGLADVTGSMESVRAGDYYAPTLVWLTYLQSAVGEMGSVA